MKKKWRARNGKDSAEMMRYFCGAAMLLPFVTAFRIPIVSHEAVLVLLLFFEGYLLFQHKKLLLDVKFFFLLAAVVLHEVIFRYMADHRGIVTSLELTWFSAMFYLLGKQLTLYPEGENGLNKIVKITAVILAGHFLVSISEFYEFRFGPSYPSRIWTSLWSGEIFYATQYSFYAVVWVSLLFFCLWNLKKKSWTGLGFLVGMVIINVLNVLNNNRMYIGVMAVVFVFSLIIFCIQNRRNWKANVGVLSAASVVVIVIMLILAFDVGNIKETYFVSRLLRLTPSQDARFLIYRTVFPQMPHHLWGGREMDMAGYGHAHCMWLQMYDETGIFPFSCMCLFMLLNIWDWIKIIASSKVPTEIKYMIPPICLGLTLYLLFEVGGDNYILYYVFFAGIAAQVVQNIKKQGQV